MDPRTAKGVYLDWWGERIGVNRNIEINGNYVTLNDDYFRFLLYYRALSNISDTTSYTVNNLLSMLIDLPIFVQDDLDMTFKIYIMGSPTPLQRTIIKEYGLLNRPAGVILTISRIQGIDFICMADRMTLSDDLVAHQCNRCIVIITFCKFLNFTV